MPLDGRHSRQWQGQAEMFAGKEFLVRIGEFARQAGVSPRSLRHYEEASLLVPARTSAGYRDYNPKDVGMTSNHHAPYDLGYTRATMAGTTSRKPVTAS